MHFDSLVVDFKNIYQHEIHADGKRIKLFSAFINLLFACFNIKGHQVVLKMCCLQQVRKKYLCADQLTVSIIKHI